MWVYYIKFWTRSVPCSVPLITLHVSNDTSDANNVHKMEVNTEINSTLCLNEV